jgi:hypothetical protein
MVYYKSNTLYEAKHTADILEGLGPSDILVANWGAWYNTHSTNEWGEKQEGQLTETYTTVIDPQMKAVPPKNRPRIVFRESAAQHFDFPGGLWPGSSYPMKDKVGQRLYLQK